MKTLLTFTSLFSISFLLSDGVKAQNTFPASGRAGIYTTTPIASLQVAGGARFGRPAQYLDIDSATGNLSFGGNASLRIGGNRYAFQYSGDPDYGLFFNSTNSRYEFRDGAAIPVFYIGANTGEGVFSSSVTVGDYTFPAIDGAANQVLKTNGAGVLTWSNDNAGSAGWSLAGNAGTSSAANFLGTTDAVDLVFRSNNIEGMRLTNANRRLGLGTTGPTSKLHINAAAAEDALRVQTNGTTRLFIDDAGGVSVGSTASGPVNGLYVSGNVGIGNSIPTNKLDVSGTAAFTGIVGIRGATNAGYALNVNGSSSYGGINITDPVDNTAFYVSKSGINYGIYIQKTNTGSGVATIYSTNAGTGAGVYGHSDNGTGVNGNSTENYGIYGYSTNSYGIYAYSANYRGLYAEGDPLYYTAYFNGDTYSTGSYLGSDAKLKKNIQDMNNAMDIINQLKPKHYEYRNDGDYAKMNLPKGNHFGLVAQDVEKILPNLVKESSFETKDAIQQAAKTSEADASATAERSEKIDFKAVNYTELIPILVKALQEQDAKIESLKKELRELKQSEPAVTSAQSTDAVKLNNTTVSSLRLMPNPAKSSITINGLNKSGTVNIVDIQGRQVMRQAVSGSSLTLNISAIPVGTYILQYLDNGKTQAIKFIKE